MEKFIELSKEYINNKNNFPEYKLWKIAWSHPMTQALNKIPNYIYNKKINKYQIYKGFSTICRLTNEIPAGSIKREILIRDRNKLVKNIVKYLKGGL